MLLINGSCEDCPNYFVQTKDGKDCEKVVCKANEIYSLVESKCMECP